MSDLQDPIQPQLWDTVQEITHAVDTSIKDTSAEQRAIAWRVSEGINKEIIEKIKAETNLPKNRFDLAEKFFSEAKETEDELKQDKIELNPVSEETKQYMIEGLLMGIAEFKENNNPEELKDRVNKILNIVNRAAEVVGLENPIPENRNLGATYITKEQIKYLGEKLNIIALFGIGPDMDSSFFEQMNDILQKILQ